ncbi:MAG TPA: hypothetical protein VGH76_07600, partial [Actinomycetospora sp.]|uniref:hypothetical protein n=1 Tax=Actinomycetospora sp. TaxID=1872135 RepID=UPI002F3F83C1
TSSSHVLRPEGPFSLDLARGAVMRWAPVSRFSRDAARPLVLAAIADDSPPPPHPSPPTGRGSRSCSG